MKNKSLFLIGMVITAVIAFYSCSKDKDNLSDEEMKNFITSNTWAYDTLEISNENDIGLIFAALAYQMVYDGGEYEFDNDGTYTLTSTLAGTMNGDWEIQDGKMIMDQGTGDEATYEVLTVNNSKLDLKFVLEGSTGYLILKFISQ